MRVNLHWTDEEFVASLYGVGPQDGHLDRCNDCRLRRSRLLANREVLESAADPARDVTVEFLTAQRRAIYKKLETRSAWSPLSRLRRWAPAALTLLVLGSGAVLYQARSDRAVGAQLSDAQLAMEVSKMSQEWQGPPAEPLQGLFE